MTLLSEALAWAASINPYIGAAIITSTVNLVTAALVWRTARKSQAEQLEFTRRIKEYEADLERRNKQEELRFKNAYDAVRASQTCARETLTQFKKMLDESRTKDAEEFLVIFANTITSYNEFSKQISLLEYIALPGDKKDLREIENDLLGMLMAMRLEKERRVNDPEFNRRVDAQAEKLQKIKQRLDIKYIRILRPNN